MKILGLFIFAAAIGLSIYAYYTLGNISYAIWRPDKASTKWVAIAESAPVQMFTWFFKYAVPVTLIIALFLIVCPLVERMVLYLVA